MYMVKINDIYRKIGLRLDEQNFLTKDFQEQKELVDSELKIYLISKIEELGFVPNIDERNDVNGLVNNLGLIIPVDKHFDTIRHLTHYVLSIAGIMQQREIIWYSQNDSMLSFPTVDIDECGIWDSLTTIEDNSYVEIFEYTYDVFINKFMKRSKIKQKYKTN